MGELEKGFILGSLAQMDQASKNFVLGYMAGRCSDVSATDDHREKKEDKRLEVEEKTDDSEKDECA